MLAWLGRPYSQVTRTEVAYTAHLHHLWQVHGTGAFLAYAARTSGVAIDPSAAWEPAFEACFYRDVCKAGKGPSAAYPRKRTFDLALLSDDHIVIIEAKAQQAFEGKQLASFKKDPARVTALTGVPRVTMLALASSCCPFSDAEREVFHGPPLTWRDLATLYGDEVLRRADALFEGGGPRFQAHNEGYRTGAQLVLAHRRGERVWVGRDGGLHGARLADDVLSGRWRTVRYESNTTSAHPPSANWFPLDAFVALLGAQAG